MNRLKLKQCMGETDTAYLRRFGEMPFDTLERLKKGGFSVSESWDIVNRNIYTVTEMLAEEFKETQKKELEAALVDCPFA